MQNFFHYLIAFLPKLWTLIVPGFFFGVDEAAKHWLPSLKEMLDRVHERYRRTVEVAALVIAVYLAGFFVWSDEYANRLKLEQTTQASPYHWSRLSDAEAAALRGDLRNVQPQTVSIMCTGSYCDDLAQSLRKALDPLHWNLSCCSVSLFGGGDFQPGFHIWTTDNRYEVIGNAIEKATEGRIKVDKPDKPATDSNEFPIQIMIGPKT